MVRMMAADIHSSSMLWEGGRMDHRGATLSAVLRWEVLVWGAGITSSLVI